jgi:hypothetical protein
MSGTIYRRALGADFARLHPQLQVYFGAIGPVEASGTFSEAGSRQWWLQPVWEALAARGILFAEYGRDVPFTVSLLPVSENTVSTLRRIRFDRRTERVVADTTRYSRGRLVDAHGRGRLLMEMRPSVDEQGTFILRSGRARLKLGRFAVPVPAPRVMLRQGYSDYRQVFTIDVSMRVPLLGELFGYRGVFTLS